MDLGAALLRLAWLLLSGLIGSFPTGAVLAALLADVDIRRHGSGNIGATNMHRVLGRGFGLVTLLVDLGKGLLAVLGARMLFGDESDLVAAASGLLAFLGHCWSPLLDLRGGKGVATGAGVMLALSPGPTAVAALVWLSGLVLTHRSSVAALGAIAALPLALLALEPRWLPLGALLSGLILLRHRDNLRRLREGTET